MTFWQLNAYSEASRLRMSDQLCIQVQAAYMSAYWNSAAKSKRSLSSVLRDIQHKNPTTHKRTPIDITKVEEEFKNLDMIKELKEHGWCKI